MIDLIKGYDVSSVQGEIDFTTLDPLVRFIICKCGDGNDGIDPTYTANVAGCKSSGRCVGVYRFIFPLPDQPGNPLRDPTAQAQYHFRASGGVLPAFVDLEWPTQFGLTADGKPDGWATWGCSASQITQWLLTYLQAYEALSGQKPIIYTYPDYAQSLNLPASFGADYQLWIASYETTPEVPQPWTNAGWVMWQASGGTEKLPNGVLVDVDYVRDLSLWGATTPVVQPQPAVPPVVQPPIISPPTPAPISPVVPPVSAPPVSFWQSLLNFFGV
jgi:GH25 family lysozyme M1 (1,4-beta-N-acetylmuramidase)